MSFTFTEIFNIPFKDKYHEYTHALVYSLNINCEYVIKNITNFCRTQIMNIYNERIQTDLQKILSENYYDQTYFKLTNDEIAKIYPSTVP